MSGGLRRGGALLLFGTSVFAGLAAAASFGIPQAVIAGGGGAGTGGTYTATGTVGQGVLATSAGGTFAVSGGFWAGATGVGTAPTFQSAASRRTHRAAGDFDLVLGAIPISPTIEPRQGPAQNIVFTFDRPVNAATVAVTEGAAIAGAPTFVGNAVVVGLTGVTNQQYVTVSLSGVASTDGGTGGTASVRVGFLTGDVNQSRAVSIADLGIVNAQLAQPVSAANYLKDVNASGTLTLADKAITNANLSKSLPAP